MTMKFLKDIYAGAKVTGVALLMIVALMGVAFVIMPTYTIVRAGTADFDDYINVTIDHTKIDAALANFPVWVYNDTAVLEGLNETSFSFYDGTGGAATELNWELELFTSGTGVIGAWVNVSSISDSADTVFHLFYDNANSTDGGENNVSDVWDSDYVAVWHMDDLTTSTLEDSTWNAVNCTKEAVDTPNEILAKVGYGQEFTGNEWIEIAQGYHGNLSALLDGASQITVSVWLRIDAIDADRYILKEQIRNSGTGGVWLRIEDTDDYLKFGARSDSDDDAQNVDYTVVSSSTYRYFWGIIDYPNDYMMSYNNNSLEIGSSVTFNRTTYVDGGTVEYNDTIGSSYGNPPTTQMFDGVIDEMRISKINRTAAWRSACYYSMNDPSTFLTFGDISGTESSFSVAGGVGTWNNITWAITSVDGSAWSNDTAAPGATFRVITHVNASDNVTDIYIEMCNLSYSTNWILANNLVAVVSIDNNDSYDAAGYDLSSGVNFSLNDNWIALSDDANPFPIDDVGWTNYTFNIRFYLDTTQSTVGTYVNVSAWNAHWKLSSS